MPFLLWRTGWHPIFQVAVFALEEWAWNVFPSTRASSATVVGIYELVLVGVWMNWDRDEEPKGEEGAERGDDDKIWVQKVD